ncbi:MAG: YdcF family protein [Patescibacteria group bacterium]
MSARRTVQTLAVLCAVLVFAYGAILANVYRHAGIDQTRVIDVIIVLGASQWNGTPSPVFQARLDHAYDLYEEGYAPRIILTGGSGEGDVFSESDVGRKYLALRGVPSDAIHIEEVSHTTVQNLRESARIMQTHGYQSALLVSHDFHMMRAKRMAHDLGINAHPSPVATANDAQQLKYGTREVWTYVLYRMFGI